MFQNGNLDSTEKNIEKKSMTNYVHIIARVATWMLHARTHGITSRDAWLKGVCTLKKPVVDLF